MTATTAGITQASFSQWKPNSTARKLRDIALKGSGILPAELRQALIAAAWETNIREAYLADLARHGLPVPGGLVHRGFRREERMRPSEVVKELILFLDQNPHHSKLFSENLKGCL
ncbi:hypothetical protein FRC07_010518 [Ceratobasidium sp. 392]|nr:hypothetical protein FRC07_010518 [Ceratobasidium sp. 392]